MRHIKRVLASIALLFALSAPSHAAITQIVGGGTNGQIGNASNNSGSTLTTGASTVDVPIGSLVTMGVGQRAASQTTSSCTDSAGNSYSNITNKTSGGAESASFIWGVTTIDAPIGTTWTCNTGTAAKGLIVSAWAGAAASPLDAASATPTSGTGTAVSVGPTGTLSCPGSGNCEVLVGFFAHHNIGTVSPEGSGFTSLGTLTNVASNVHMAFQIVAANTAITYAPTAGNSDVWAAFLEAFKQPTSVTTPRFVIPFTTP